MKEPSVREKLRKEVDMNMVGGLGTSGPAQKLTVHGSAGYDVLDKYVDRKVTEIATAEGKHVADVILDISLESEFKAEFVGNAYPTSAELTKRGARLSLCCPPAFRMGARTVTLWFKALTQQICWSGWSGKKV